VGRAVGLEPERIIFHATHNHSGPMGEDFITHNHPLDELVRCLSDVAGRARDTAVPARVGFAAADVGTRFSMCRRKWINDDVANITNWYAYHNTPAGAQANHLIRERLQRWFGADFPDPEWLHEPIVYDAPADPLAQLMEFEDLSGRPLGGIMRFAAHPHSMNGADPNGYASDYPGHGRRFLDRMRGGIHLFAVGPQCNLVPRETIAYVRQPGKLNWADTPYGPDGSLVAASLEDLRRDVREMGEGLAGAALAELDEASFSPLERLELRTTWHDLPMRADVPDNSKIAWQIRDGVGEQIRADRKGGISIIGMKRLTDTYNRFHWMRQMLDNWYIPTTEEIAAKRIPVHLQAVRINDAFISGLPAETGLETSLALRAGTSGARLMTIQQCNGDIGYMVSAQEQLGGDYESTCSLIASNGLPVLHEGALRLLREVGA
jgi:hypothetical protein